MDQRDDDRRSSSGATCDAEALAQTIERCRPHLVRVAAHRLTARLRGRVDPEDVVQNALLSLAMGIQEGAFQVACEDRLLHLLETLVEDHARRQYRMHFAERRRVTREQDADRRLPNVEVDPPDPHAGPQEQVTALDLYEHVLTALPCEQQPIARMWLEAYTLKEIAHETGCCVRHVSLVLADLRRRLTDLGEAWSD